MGDAEAAGDEFFLTYVVRVRSDGRGSREARAMEVGEILAEICMDAFYDRVRVFGHENEFTFPADGGASQRQRPELQPYQSVRRGSLTTRKRGQ